MAYLDHWCDIVTMKAAREILKGVYPDDATRRSLYASCLRGFVSNSWPKNFYGLMLDRVAATPSVSTPGMPLFADIYKAHDPIIDGPYSNPPTRVLDPMKVPSLFARPLEPIEPLPSCPGIIDYLAYLISHPSREALDAAGRIITLCSLTLALVGVKWVVDVQDELLPKIMESVLPMAEPENLDEDEEFSFNGMLFRPLTDNPRPPRLPHAVLKRYLILLVVGQYAGYLKSGDTAPRDDVMFLERGYLTEAKFGRLEVVHLYKVQEMTGLHVAVLNQLLREHACSEAVAESSLHVAEYLRGAEGPNQMTRPWCRAVDYHLFSKLNVRDNIDCAVRLGALLASDLNDELWKRRAFSGVPESRIKDALLWAPRFKEGLCTGKYE